MIQVPQNEVGHPEKSGSSLFCHGENKAGHRTGRPPLSLSLSLSLSLRAEREKMSPASPEPAAVCLKCSRGNDHSSRRGGETEGRSPTVSHGEPIRKQGEGQGALPHHHISPKAWARESNLMGRKGAHLLSSPISRAQILTRGGGIINRGVVFRSPLDKLTGCEAQRGHNFHARMPLCQASKEVPDWRGRRERETGI